MRENESSSTQRPKEFGGKSVEHAIEIACGYFGVGHADLEIKILNRESIGIFGLGEHKAKIRAMPKKRTVLVAKEEQKKEEKSPKKENEVSEKTPRDRDRDICLAKEITEGLLNRAGLEGQVEIKANEGRPCLDISGEDLSIIIGKEGQNLDALEYILNRILQYRDKDYPKIKLEAEGYREKKEKGLTLLAHRMAKKVQKTGRSTALQPLGSKERRIIHLALKGIKGIRSHSIGDGLMRRVVITPVHRTSRPPRRSPKDNGNGA
ncbi:MAG: KH domain-containing protein [Nitrospiraceae bacterium]|nr:KH domain-containing protein [Nitrospiraceae bacterium]